MLPAIVLVKVLVPAMVCAVLKSMKFWTAEPVPPRAMGSVPLVMLVAFRLDKLAPLALFAVEAITNAQKHAFAGRGGFLRVSFHVQDDEADLQIADDGPGDAPRVASGVGRTLMTAFARQLHGRSEILANEWGGTTARLIFPIPDAQTVPFTGEGARPKRNRAAA